MLVASLDPEKLNRAARGDWPSEEVEREWHKRMGEDPGEFRYEVMDRLDVVPLSTTLDTKTEVTGRKAEVVALKHAGLSHPAVAMVLGIDESTVGEYVRRARQDITKAEDLVDICREYNIDL